MSWQQYVDVNLCGTGNVSEAAICGHDGNPWASSAGLTSVIKPAEVAAIVRGFSDPTSVQGGIHLGGVKYMFLRCDGDVMNGQKGPGKSIVVNKTNQAVIIGIWDNSVNPNSSAGNCSKTVGDVAEYLKQQSF